MQIFQLFLGTLLIMCIFFQIFGRFYFDQFFCYIYGAVLFVLWNCVIRFHTTSLPFFSLFPIFS